MSNPAEGLPSQPPRGMQALRAGAESQAEARARPNAPFVCTFLFRREEVQ